MILRNIALAFLLASCTAQATLAQKPEEPVDESWQEENFSAWLEDFKQRALYSGISHATLNAAFKNTYPLPKVINLDRKQPEHVQTKEEYLAKVINDVRIEKGRALLVENQLLLNNIAAQTGVEPEYIVALWGLESGYGENTGNYSTINALATLAYEGRRREFFENELLSALLIIDQGNISAEKMKGSWAGAMGQCQFMPSSFLAYAVDYDRDGRTDIWGNRQDILASIANYLSRVGWGKDMQAKERALMHWNKSNYFVTSVFELAEAIR